MGEIEKMGSGWGFGMREFGFQMAAGGLSVVRERGGGICHVIDFLFLDFELNKRLGERLRTVVYSGRYQSIQSFTSTFLFSSVKEILGALLR
jgi:hypothetical protein